MKDAGHACSRAPWCVHAIHPSIRRTRTLAVTLSALTVGGCLITPYGAAAVPLSSAHTECNLQLYYFNPTPATRQKIFVVHYLWIPATTRATSATASNMADTTTRATR